MAQQAKAFAAKPDNLKWPWTHIIEAKNQFPQIVPLTCHNSTQREREMNEYNF